MLQRFRSVLFVVMSVFISLGVACGYSVTTVRVASGLSRPIYVTAPAGDLDRLFIVEQHTGRIKILNLDTGLINVTPFLDMSGLSTWNEQGLLGMAFDPDYSVNGFFYVNFTDSGGSTNIRRYQVSAGDGDIADAGSAFTIMSFSQPFSNHNGGWIGFGPDGYLYICTGDGGSGGDPGNRSQDITSQRLGKILRIDVNGGSPYAIPASNPFVGITGDDEIWAYGLRNPWRSSFDRVTGDLYIADVGQSAREEVDFQAASSGGGENYGWRVMEGMRCNSSGDALPCSDPSFTAPIHEYSHGGGPDGGFSITGGYVYRGPIKDLQGVYFFADYVSDQIWSFRFDGVTKTEFTNRTAELSPAGDSISSISSFGEDGAGNLYIVDLNGGVFKVVCEPGIIGDFNGSCDEDLADYAMLSSAWLSVPGDGEWNVKYDISSPADNLIDISDLAAFVSGWLDWSL